MPMNYALPISVRPVGTSLAIEGKVEDFDILPPINPMTEFEDDQAWLDTEDGFTKAKEDPTILLDKFELPDDKGQALVEGIRNRTASIVSDGSYNSYSPI